MIMMGASRKQELDGLRSNKMRNVHYIMSSATIMSCGWNEISGLVTTFGEVWAR